MSSQTKISSFFSRAPPKGAASKVGPTTTKKSPVRLEKATRDCASDSKAQRPSKKRKIIDSDDDMDPSDCTPTPKNVKNEIPKPAESPTETTVSATQGRRVVQKKSISFEKLENGRLTPRALGMLKDSPDQKDATPGPVSAAVRRFRTNTLAAPTVADNDDKVKSTDGRYEWAENVRDKDGRKPGEPGYDPRTLYIPDSKFQKLTGFEKQYWTIKKDYFDTIIFFKKGKFYELFEGDADIGHTLLGLKMTDRVNMRMVGVPESHFHKWAKLLVDQGYKVGRVEQMETLSTSVKKRKDTGTKSTVCERELVQVLTQGTLVDPEMIGHPDANYLLAIKEDIRNNAYGICFVDTATGRFHVGRLEDDSNRSRMETLLMQLKPKEVVREKGDGEISKATARLLRQYMPTTKYAIISLIPEQEFWTGPATRDHLLDAGYFKNSDDDAKEGHSLPDVLAEADDLEMSAVGGCVSYLRNLLISDELLSLRHFYKYDAVRGTNRMILDGTTLRNLDILENSADGGRLGSMFGYIDHTVTPFGKRLLRLWLCRPLFAKEDINARFDAVDLINSIDYTVLTQVKKGFASLPDLERMLSRMHAGGRSASKGVMFSNVLAKKVRDFLSVLEGFESVMRLLNLLRSQLPEDEADSTSQLLRSLCSFDGRLPNLRPLLDFFDSAFDKQKAMKEGCVVPLAGCSEEFDDILERIEACQAELECYLKAQRSRLSEPALRYYHAQKDKYQIEVPSSFLNKKSNVLPAEFSLVSSAKNSKRYYTPELTSLVASLKTVEEEKDALIDSLFQKLLAKFSEGFNQWSAAVECVAEIDAIMSLAVASQADGNGPKCRPEIIESDKPTLDLRSVWHPCVAAAVSSFIPNDVSLGANGVPRALLVTGPNMGGKSTLLRQACLAVVFAQIGCYVPAASCKMTPVDRVFTRIGAQDNIVAGQSTFMVELQETSTILRHATDRSLVILDELGRGTSTYDGYAIAYATLNFLTEKVGCRMLFSTHYHSLSEEIQENPKVDSYHMACDVDEENKRVTFLYKFLPGVASKSHGIHCANLAGVPRTIVDRAADQAKLFEEKIFGFNSGAMVD